VASIEIHAISTVSGNQPRIRRIIEKAEQSFLPGTPVEIDSSTGAVIPWDGSTIAGKIAGTSKEQAANLTTTGVAQQVTQGSVPNQSAAANIQRPYFNDGRTGIEIANPDSIFQAQVGPSQTTAATDVGTQYGLTKDADNHWYVDKTKATPGTNTVLTVVKLDPNDQSATPRGVYFTFLPAACQLFA
jgi:hypothetical protein